MQAGISHSRSRGSGSSWMPGGCHRRNQLSSRGDTQPQEPAGTQGDVAAIQTRDLATRAARLDGIRGNPIKMHQVVSFCRNNKRHDPSAGNGQSSSFFFLGKLWGYNGSYAAHGALLFEDDELHSHRNAVWRQTSLCSASKSSFGQHTFNKTRTFWKKKPGGEKQEQPQV